MNNLIIAALTCLMLPAVASQASAKSNRNCKEAKTEIVVEKKNFTREILNEPATESQPSSVNVDYIIGEDGKAYITYIQAESEKAKYEVVKFIENASFNFNPVPGKIYTMKLTLNQ